MKKLLILFTFITSLAHAQGPWLNQNTYTAAGTNTYTVTIPMYLGYVAGNEVKIKFTNANSGASTINISNGTTSYGAKTLQKNGSAVASGDLVAGGTYRITYDGTNFQVLGIGGSGGGGSGWALNGNTVGSLQWLGTIDNFDLPFRTNNTEIGRFKTSGQLQLGTANVVSLSPRFQVRTFGSSQSTRWGYVEDSGGNGVYSFYDDGSVTAGGNAINPFYKLISSSGITSKLQTLDSGFGGSTYGTETNHPLGFLVNNSIVAQISTGGLFGVGTTAATNFHVKTATGNTTLRSEISDNAGVAVFQALNNNGDVFEIGKAGSGRTPSGAINASDAYIDGRTSGNLVLSASAASGAIVMATGSSITERLRINSTGAIGLAGANYGTSGQVLTSAGSSTPPSWTTLGSVTPSANSLVLRDANANHFANNEILGFQSIATAGGTTTLTVASPYETQFTGTSAQTLVLPNATTLTVGQSFHINNSSTLAITINTNGGAGLFTMATGTDITLVCTSIGTAAGTWEIDYLGLSVATTKRLTVNHSLTLAGTDATTMTFPTTSATIARTDAANTFTGVQTMTSPSITTSTTTASTTFSNFNTTATTVNDFGAATTYTLGGTPTTALTATLFGNATATATTKTLNIATAGAAGSTTNVNIGSSVASAILGTISLNAPTILTANNNTTVALWNTNSTNINFGGAVTGTLKIGNSAGLVASAARVTAPNHINGFTTTATAAATTTLTVTSNFIQTFTGTTTQTLTLPVVTTMVNGQMFRIVNLSTGVVTVNTSGANTIKAMAANSTIDVWVINTAGGTGTASWNWLYTAAINN